MCSGSYLGDIAIGKAGSMISRVISGERRPQCALSITETTRGICVVASQNASSGGDVGTRDKHIGDRPTQPGKVGRIDLGQPHVD